MENKLIASKAQEFLGWLTKLFESINRKEIDNFLSKSNDVYDLERRIQTLAKRGLM